MRVWGRCIKLGSMAGERVLVWRSCEEAARCAREEEAQRRSGAAPPGAAPPPVPASLPLSASPHLAAARVLVRAELDAGKHLGLAGGGWGPEATDGGLSRSAAATRYARGRGDRATVSVLCALERSGNGACAVCT